MAQGKNGNTLKKEEREVLLFARAFITDFENEKDIAKVNKDRYFLDFDQILVLFDLHWDGGHQEFLKKVDTTIRKRFLIEQFNSFYLQNMMYWSIPDNDSGHRESEDDEWEYLKRVLPPKVFKTQKALFDLAKSWTKEQNEDFKLITVQQLVDFNEALKNQNVATREFLNSLGPQKISRYHKKINWLREDATNRVTKCLTDCSDSSNHKPIFNVKLFPYDIDIIKINGKLKIISIIYHDND